MRSQEFFAGWLLTQSGVRAGGVMATSSSFVGACTIYREETRVIIGNWIYQMLWLWAFYAENNLLPCLG